MYVRLFVACAVSFVLLSSRSLAADPASPQEARIAALEKKAVQLQKDIGDLDASVIRLTKVLDQHADAVGKLAADAAKLTQTVGEITEKSSKTADDIQALRDRVDALMNLVKKAETQGEGLADIRRDLQSIGQTLASISEVDSSGNRYLALANSMKTEQGREQVTGAVLEALQQRRDGVLRITNRMTYEVRVSVNRQNEYRVRPNETLMLNRVPAGTVTVELVGWEGPRNWTIGAPDYEQNIDIIPRGAPARVVYESQTLLGMY